MKKIISSFLFVCILSCGKENLLSPAASIQSSAISFTSNNIAISNFKAQAANNGIMVGFTTSFQKDVQSLEILRGTTPATLCSIYKTGITSDSHITLQYTAEDNQTASTLYYIVKYTLRDNDWGYTPMFTLQSDHQ